MARHIGRFEILSELGRGAQSVVYRGFDPHLQREVALKTLSLGRPGSPRSARQIEDNARLMAEARTVSKLRHPNIVTIFEAGEEGNEPYLVFEYVAGRNLEQLLRADGALPPPRAAGLMVAILDALIQAHAQGIIHRDLKPSNILIDGSGTPRVMDFGISVGLLDEQLQEAERGLLGTPCYMSPEYVKNRVVSASSDIYAAGLVLLEMLSGRRAVEGKSLAEILSRVANEPICLPADMPIDERLGDIILSRPASPIQRRALPAPSRCSRRLPPISMSASLRPDPKRVRTRARAPWNS